MIDVATFSFNKLLASFEVFEEVRSVVLLIYVEHPLSFTVKASNVLFITLLRKLP
jgi:hypothetical protein